MTVVVADTSALVSLGGARKDILGMLVEENKLLVPRQVVDELEETASYDDEQGRAAEKALRFVEESIFKVRSVDLDPEFPLDRGENAAVALANSENADLFLCDEFNRIGLIHASLSDARLVTTPKLLEVFVHRRRLSRSDAVAALDSISDLRSWGNNSYVERVREILDG
jgi:predicted nucleic acid-binding protein